MHERNSGNPGARMMAIIAALEMANEDDTLRQEHRERNNILIGMYREKLKYYEVRN